MKEAKIFICLNIKFSLLSNIWLKMSRHFISLVQNISSYTPTCQIKNVHMIDLTLVCENLRKQTKVEQHSKTTLCVFCCCQYLSFNFDDCCSSWKLIPKYIYKKFCFCKLFCKALLTNYEMRNNENKHL